MADTRTGRGGASRRPDLAWGDLPAGQTAADGFVVVDKPAGVTSHDVVGALRRLAGTRKVGHAGTLDPFATGVLVVGIGRATKLMRFVSGSTKAYRARVRLGVGMDTEDLTGRVVDAPGIPAGTDSAAIDTAMARLTGEVVQVPSAYSAKKVDGRRAYELARAGEAVTLAGARVRIERFERISPVAFDEVSVPTQPVAGDKPGGARTVRVADFDAEVTCSEGTYIRALARDLGAALGSAGHLLALRRLRVGAWELDRARTVEQLAAEVRERGAITPLPLSDVARALFPAIAVSEEEAWLLRHGQFIPPRAPEVGGRGIGEAYAEDTDGRGAERDGARRAEPREDGLPAAVLNHEAVAVVTPFRGELKTEVLLRV